MAIDEDHLRNILATAIRNAARDPVECVENEEECFQQHPIHGAAFVNGITVVVEAEVDGLVDVILQAIKHDAFCFRPFIARSGWTPWRSS